MASRRQFLRQTTALTTGAITLPPFLLDSPARPLPGADLKTPAEWAQDEDFWARIKSDYTVSPTLLNLNNGGV